jgi:hypothetical protein
MLHRRLRTDGFVDPCIPTRAPSRQPAPTGSMRSSTTATGCRQLFRPAFFLFQLADLAVDAGKDVLDHAVALDVEQRLRQRGLPVREIGLCRPYAAQIPAEFGRPRWNIRPDFALSACIIHIGALDLCCVCVYEISTDGSILRSFGGSVMPRFCLRCAILAVTTSGCCIAARPGVEDWHRADLARMTGGVYARRKTLKRNSQGRRC